MGRAPCCEKMGLKKGPWTAEEDLILVNYINQNGHGNWRALPKRAGLLRCGKSCRLRWMNYLRPDIKRGNFTKEEENTIIKLHEELGNKWSVIAARLPGRTDNEIKNVWHTHLKKSLIKKSQPKPEAQIHTIESSEFDQKVDNDSEPNSPAHSSSDISSVTVTNTASAFTARGPDGMISDSLDNFPEMDESFWLEVFSADNSSATSDFSAGNSDFQLQFSMEKENVIDSDLYMESGMDFWYDLFNKAEELIELPQF